jgi:hypothetical protein
MTWHRVIVPTRLSVGGVMSVGVWCCRILVTWTSREAGSRDSSRPAPLYGFPTPSCRLIQGTPWQRHALSPAVARLLKSKTLRLAARVAGSEDKGKCSDLVARWLYKIMLCLATRQLSPWTVSFFNCTAQVSRMNRCYVSTCGSSSFLFLHCLVFLCPWYSKYNNNNNK